MRRLSPPAIPLTGSRRLAAMLSGAEGVGPWPDRQDAERWRSQSAPVRAVPGKRRSAQISGALIDLATRLSATASATYARIGLGSIEARVLTVIAAEPQTSAQISKLIGVDRAAVCRSVQALQERDLVLKMDGRTRLVSLTQDGAALIEAIGALSAERERRLLASLAPHEAEAVLAFLGRFMLNVPELVELAESGVFESMRDPALS
jgi:DNA-binding MarR family transcriptional regulator